MGKQISFYMTIADEQKFNQYLCSNYDVVILPNISSKELKELYHSFSDLGEENGNLCYLWNRSISPPPPVKFNPDKGCYRIDFMQAEVIQVRRSKIDEKKIYMGRLYLETSYLSNERIIKKSDQFLKWYDLLARYIRKNSEKIDYNTYILPSALDLNHHGLELGYYSF
jgi:hypothetical protein